MSGNRYIKRTPRRGAEPKIGRMFLVSCALHLLVLALFTGLPFSSEQVRRPVYYVDLTQLPVANPQAGRPDARPPEQKKTKAPAVRDKPAVKPATSAAPKLSKSDTPKTSKTPNEQSDAAIASKIEKLRAEQEREELKAKLAALAADDRRGEDSGVEAPLGMPDAHGSEVGVSQLAWLQAYLKEMWSLSRYQVNRLDLKARAQLLYSGDGRLLDYKITESSGDEGFDESVRKAIGKASKLEFEPAENPWRVDVEFNLKELMQK